MVAMMIGLMYSTAPPTPPTPHTHTQPETYPCNAVPFSYEDFVPSFTAEFFNATEWAQLFK